MAQIAGSQKQNAKKPRSDPAPRRCRVPRGLGRMAHRPRVLVNRDAISRFGQFLRNHPKPSSGESEMQSRVSGSSSGTTRNRVLVNRRCNLAFRAVPQELATCAPAAGARTLNEMSSLFLRTSHPVPKASASCQAPDADSRVRAAARWQPLRRAKLRTPIPVCERHPLATRFRKRAPRAKLRTRIKGQGPGLVNVLWAERKTTII